MDPGRVEGGSYPGASRSVRRRQKPSLQATHDLPYRLADGGQVLRVLLRSAGTVQGKIELESWCWGRSQLSFYGQVKDWTTTTINYTKQRPIRLEDNTSSIGDNR